jgi:indole-3-glycerol phosphate synthase
VTELGMTPLVETHSREELERAADLGARLIGVNARTSRPSSSTATCSARSSSAFRGCREDRRVRGARSSDVAHYREAGADVVLVGEALVTNDPVSTLHAFLEAGS